MAEKIWGYLYKCRVPVFRSRSIEDIKQNGMIITGIRDLDEAMKNDIISKWITINQMVEYYKQGVPVYCKDKDIKDIYDTVQTHLAQWMEQLRTGLNIGDAPIDDLMAMDQFAATLFPHAKHMFTPEAIESALATQLGNVQRVNMTNFFSGIGSNKVGVTRINAIENKKDDVPDRESFAERLKQSVQSLRRY